MSQNADRRSALIVGAGIGGLAAGLAFARRGWRVQVLEQAAALEEVGAGIQLAPNGMKVVRALGLEQAILTRGFLPEALELRLGRSGRRLFSLPIKTAAHYRWRAPYVQVHRADLVDVLAGALADCAPGSLRLGCRVARVEAGGRLEAGTASGTATGTAPGDASGGASGAASGGASGAASGAAVVLEGGERLSADLIVAADGFRSPLRAQVFGTPPARYTGMMAWRACVPTAALGAVVPPPSACVWAGPGRHAVTYPVRRGELFNFVGIVETAGDGAQDAERRAGPEALEPSELSEPPEAYDSWQTSGSVEAALADFAGWDQAVLRLIQASGGLGRWALFDRPPSSHWHRGRLVLLGDAAHPMLPTFAQGGCQALEDAWALAALVDRAVASADGGGEAALQAAFEGALAAYTALRQPRTRTIQHRALRNARDFHHRGGLEAMRAYGTLALGGRLLPWAARGRLDPIYGYDVVGATAR